MTTETPAEIFRRCGAGNGNSEPDMPEDLEEELRKQYTLTPREDASANQ